MIVNNHFETAPVAPPIPHAESFTRCHEKGHICLPDKCGLFRTKCSASAEREVCFASEAHCVREVFLRHDGRRNTSHRARHDASQRQRRCGGTSLYAFGSSPAGTCPRPTGSNGLPARGAPGGLHSRSRGTSVTDAAYPLRVRALRRGCDRRFVGHDHWACRPRSGRRYRRTGLYKVGSSCTGGGTFASAACGGRSEQKGVAESRRLASVLRTR